MTVNVVGFPGYEDFQGEEVGRLLAPDGTQFVIILDEYGEVIPVPARYVEEA